MSVVHQRSSRRRQGQRKSLAETAHLRCESKKEKKQKQKESQQNNNNKTATKTVFLFLYISITDEPILVSFSHTHTHTHTRVSPAHLKKEILSIFVGCYRLLFVCWLVGWVLAVSRLFLFGAFCSVHHLDSSVIQPSQCSSACWLCRPFGRFLRRKRYWV